MIEFKNIKKVFPDGTEAIKGINLLIPEGELTALIGPSGCGKTTTMKMINKLVVPTEGSIYINGEEIASKNDVELRRNIGYVIQRIGLLPHMTIEDNIALIPKLKGWTKEQYEPRVDELMKLVGLEPEVFRKRYPLELSGGQQQRVGVIRALAAEPPIILMDEPFSALDPISREQLQDELKSLQQKIHKTIVFVTHDMDEALKIADKIAVMKDGVIEQYGTPDELLASPANEFVRSFIGEHRISRDTVKSVINDIMSLAFQDITESISHTIPTGSSISYAAMQFLQLEVDILGVEDEGETIGYVTKEDILRSIAKEGTSHAG